MASKKLTNREILDQYINSKKNAQETVSEQVKKISGFYCIVRNIPATFKSKDLRIYFSDYTENGRFDCFHYRHRPELHDKETRPQTIGEDGKTKREKTETCCCTIRFKSTAERLSFLKDYNGKHWTDPSGMPLPRRCYISALKVVTPSEASTSDSLTEKDVLDMIELKPPAVMPNGNVGTPSSYFLEQIRLCMLPASIIPKLGIKRSRRIRKFGSVQYNYDGEEEEYDDPAFDATEANRREEQNEKECTGVQSVRTDADFDDPTDQAVVNDYGADNDEGADKDDDECEEFERYEANYDDVTEQDRTKPKKYEEEMEVVWEKGGPGLVWHMDKNYWDEREKGTDCDWAWADDWDVDYSVYYNGKSQGTLDARDAVEIQEDEAKRSGKLSETVFTKKTTEKTKRKRRRSFSSTADVEQYSRKIGSKLLLSMGWKSGQGLGKKNQGLIEPVAIEVEEGGQAGRDRIGFGYHGEKLQRYDLQKRPEHHTIVTKYDSENDSSKQPYKRVDDNDQSSEILFRRSETTKMKYR